MRARINGRRVSVRTQLIALFLLGSLLFAADVGAADRDRPIRIGALTPSWGPTPPVIGLRDGLVELGYREEKDFVLGVRFTRGDIAALPAAARELVAYGVDLIFVETDAAAQAAQQATTEIPIVFGGVSDPIGLGSIASFARPGGNVTGVTDLELTMGPKRLQIFQETIPHLKRVLFPYDATQTDAARLAQVYGEAAQRLGIKLIVKAVTTQAEAEATLSTIRTGEIDGILSPWSPTLNIPGFVMAAETAQAIPAMYSAMFYVEHGGLVSYGPDSHETGRQAARLVDKILKGAKPAELPVEVNPKIKFVINLKTAKALGLTIPPEVLYQADRLIR